MSERIGRKVRIRSLGKAKIADEVSMVCGHIAGGEFEAVIQRIETEDGRVFVRFGYYKNGRWTNRPLNMESKLARKLVKYALEKGIF
ncbi:hypothetical protein DRO54_01035 [Candidatus Bathyarchaeota archaeon]|nr:MAG: hypothetical protein DRO54_01035 [Candidatus Bathyarchaeota archaeon]